MPVSAITAIETRELVRVVNRRERPRRALTRLLFPQSTHRTLTTETVQIDELTGTDSMAPFIERDGEAIAVEQDNGQSYTIDTPMISVKRSLTASNLLLLRRAGEMNIFTGAGQNISEEHIVLQIADDLAKLERVVNKREEWLAAMLLRGEINYSVDGKASFKVTLSKPIGNTLTAPPNGVWTGSTPKPRTDIAYIQRLCNTNEVGSVTDAIGDSTAAAALDAMIEAKVVTLDPSGSLFNTDVDLVATYDPMGMRFIGKLGGVRFWEYNASYADDTTGVATTFIRPGYFEFVSTTNEAAADRVMFYGAIMDIEAIRNGVSVTERFSKVIEKQEPSSLVNILKSRPLPWFYNPKSTVSMKVTS